MYSSLLFNESPIIGGLSLLITVLSYEYDRKVFIVSVIVLLCLLIFYRYESHNIRYRDNILISPAEGKITYIKQEGDTVWVSIFMGVHNNHTQLYPVNGTVVERIYDETGQFNIVIDREKSRFNEKKIHKISTSHGEVTVTQIAGFLPRRISSSEVVPLKVRAGEYLGMIKFGSRIDVSFIGDIKKLKKNLGDNIKIGDIIYKWI